MYGGNEDDDEDSAAIEGRLHVMSLLMHMHTFAELTLIIKFTVLI
jgi:hypothetical protein